jgi:outer membrane protein OmpA-like peptidoglycan-associated protein
MDIRQMTARRLMAISRVVMTIPLVAATAGKAADQPQAERRIEIAQAQSPEEAAKKKREAEERAKKANQQQQTPSQRPPEGRRGQQQVPQKQPTVGSPVQPEKKSPFLEKRIVPPASTKVTPIVPPKQPENLKVIPVLPPKGSEGVKVAPIVPPKGPVGGTVTPFVPPKGPVGGTVTPIVPPKGPVGGTVTPFVPPKGPVGGTVTPFVPPKGPVDGTVTPVVPVNPAVAKQFLPSSKASTPPPSFDQLQKSRSTRVEGDGRRTVIQESGNRIIIKQDNRVIIRHDEAERFRRLNNARTFRRPNGITETFYIRPDGFRVVTEVDRNGRLLRRYRRGPDGREYIIIDNRNFWRNAGIAVGIGAVGTIIALNLRPPVVTIPRERYIVDYDRVSDDDLYDTLIAPPVERLDRVYSLEEVRGSHELRERVRRIDLDSINFEFGSLEVGPDQFGKLERLARAISRLINANPDSVVMIEGHTDAVGSDVDNLSLSDRRAQSVAQILTEQFGIPPENLVTQGYGEQYLKINTQGPERANRYVSIRNVTSLMSEK